MSLVEPLSERVVMETSEGDPMTWTVSVDGRVVWRCSASPSEQPRLAAAQMAEALAALQRTL